MTRDPSWAYEGVLVARSVEEAIEIGAGLDDAGERRRGSAGLRRRDAAATAADPHRGARQPEGDTHYPDFDEADWRETRREQHLDHDPAYEIRWLERAIS